MNNIYPLYTKHLRHKQEFRIHIFKNKIIDMTEKRKVSGYNNVNNWIRSHKNGWVFCRDDLAVPICVTEEAIKACQTLRLDFGAVDICYREKENRAYVLEVNTAPGLEGTTLENYEKAFFTEMDS